MTSPGGEYCESHAGGKGGKGNKGLARWVDQQAAVEQATAHPVVEADWQAVRGQLPVDLEATARESGALVRHRGIARAEDLLRLALTYALCDWSLRLVAAWACLKDWANLSDTALMWRLQGARAWLGELVAALVIVNRTELASHPVRLRLVDAAVVNGPGSKGTDWRVHVSLELSRMRFDGVEITDSKGGESLSRHPAKAGDILVGDQGYGHARAIGGVLADDGQLVVRITFNNIRLYDEQGAKLELLPWLRQAPAMEPIERQVWLKTEAGSFSVRLIAQRLDEAAAEAARRRLRQKATKHSRKPNEQRLEAAGFIMVLSNLDSARWHPGQILALYRLRWQVEMAFKRLKSVLQLDYLRAKDPDLAQTYLLAKLLGALLVDRLSQADPAPSDDWFASVERPVSPWRWLVLWGDGLRRAVQGSLPLSQLLSRLPRLQRYLCDAPRRRRQQCALARRLMRLLIGLLDPTRADPDQLLQPMALC